ncbi:MAG: hypothetical protein ACKODX_07265, partial [Gemmata sp.]
MFQAVALSLVLAPGIGDPVGPKTYPPAYIPVDAPFGYLYRPEYDVRTAVRLPATRYVPRAGDVLLLSDTDWLWTTLYRLALTGRPGHCGIVVTMPDGRLGCLDAGFNDTAWTRLTPLDYRLAQFAGHIWVRQRLVPLTPEQDARLTAFAVQAADQKYAIHSFALHATPFGPRGPVRTAFGPGPRGPGHRLFCAEAVVEALAYAGLVDERSARPRATYPQDLFYDRARNPHIDRHPPLAGGWAPPAQWTPVAGWSVKGKGVPKPPSPWPHGPAHVVYPVYGAPNKPPAPVVVGSVPGELRPVALVEQRPQRVG